MKVYMLRDNVSGLYYRKPLSYSSVWVDKEYASVWTNRNGPAQVKVQPSTKRRHLFPDEKQMALEAEIVTFELGDEV